MLAFVAAEANAQLTFSGNQYPACEITPSSSSGLKAVYVVYSTSGINMTYTASSSTVDVQVSKFGSAGAASATAVDNSQIVRNGAQVTVSSIESNTGYVFTEPSRVTYYWITDYSATPYNISSIGIEDRDECDRTFLVADGSAPRMLYYTINGRGTEIDREIKLEYTTMTADEESMRYVSAQAQKNFAYIDGVFSIEPPLCDTYFTLKGDRFMRQWGMEESVGSGRYTTTAVAAITSATQKPRDVDNEVKVESTLGGSAPAEITFKAAVTDATVFTQWLIARDEEMDDVVYRTSDLDFTYTFTDMGTFYVRFHTSDATGRCDFFSDIYTVYIGESYLRCPNAFSPGTSIGVNDEWKVSYKSIVSFECYIFNRWGEKLTEFHDPALGWDGKYKGKIVPSGVYYYVIKAKGSDGKTYSLSGDINILGQSE
ncbi:MAG: gliding motility-associated C-terminal domain-containing protein [Bacteroides sp.]|nr:gliding motility-associated C-terminal domain-containing protein [Bacteroides sp.]MCM1413358.1 gliding motility-associated C-terminal domain-containing protein [Bacteroides sp.]MCM1471956.1 gliding motility-associated C-terminal domain-containing protein [Bacteroides sp.]